MPAANLETPVVIGEAIQMYCSGKCTRVEPPGNLQYTYVPDAGEDAEQRTQPRSRMNHLRGIPPRYDAILRELQSTQPQTL